MQWQMILITADTFVLLIIIPVIIIRDVPDIRFRLAGYPAIFFNPVLAKMVPGTGYLSRIVLGPFWQLVELSSPSEWVPYLKQLVYMTH